MAGIINGELIDADELMNAYGSTFNDSAQKLFEQAYNGFDSRLNNAGAPSLKNVLYSIFTSDDTDINFGFIYDSSDDLYIAPDLSGVTEYVIIEADDASIFWTNNDTRLIKISSGKWLLYGTSGTDAVHRAQIHRSLWYGTNGTNQLIDDFTNITSVQTSHANDVGKRAIHIEATKGVVGASNCEFTFNNTSTNTNVSSWARLQSPNVTAATSQWYIPAGTLRASAGQNSTLDEMGTDTSGDENDNPADCKFNKGGSNSYTANCKVIMLCVGAITVVNSGSWTIATNTDYFADNSIPLITAADTLVNEGLGVSTLIFKDTITSTDNAITVINSTIDATSSEQISISVNGGSNWTDVNNTEIARPTAGTELWRRIVITRTDLSKEDKVTEQAVKYNFY